MLKSWGFCVSGRAKGEACRGNESQSGGWMRWNERGTERIRRAGATTSKRKRLAIEGKGTIIEGQSKDTHVC